MRFKFIAVVMSFVLLSFSLNAFAVGDCDRNGTVTISEVQSAINMFLSLNQVSSCVDEDLSGSVSISEVQKTINTFLGLIPVNVAPIGCESKIPAEQPASVRHEKTFFPSPPDSFGSVVGWVNATIGTSGITGNVTIKNLKLWENISGVKTIIAEKIICSTCDNPDDKVWGYSLNKSLWPVPSAWAKANEGSKFLISGQAVIVPVASQPNDVYHFWHALFPRPTAKTTATYFLTADVFVEGDAMVQIGIDFWNSTDSGTNIEAAVSNWACSSTVLQTIKAGSYK